MSGSCVPGNIQAYRFIRHSATKQKLGMLTAKLRRFLYSRLDMQRTGGVLFARDNHTLILADTAAFTSSHAALVETAFPHVRFSVVSCDSSASGFIVVFSAAEDNRTWRRSATRLLLHILCFIASVYVAGV